VLAKLFSIRIFMLFHGLGNILLLRCLVGGTVTEVDGREGTEGRIGWWWREGNCGKHEGCRRKRVEEREVQVM